jgi:hypothetical protein
MNGGAGKEIDHIQIKIRCMYEDIPVSNTKNASDYLKLKPRVFLYCEPHGECLT